jgi:hypothetical protein
MSSITSRGVAMPPASPEDIYTKALYAIRTPMAAGSAHMRVCRPL